MSSVDVEHVGNGSKANPSQVPLDGCENGRNDDVLENWESDQTGDVALQQVEQKMKEVKILKRSEEERKVMMQKARNDEIARAERDKEEKERQAAVGELPSPVAPGPQIKLLRRPNSGSNVNQNANQNKKPTKSLEERQAEYDAARSRILGDNYKFEPAASPPTPVQPSRSRSPEQFCVPRYPPVAMNGHGMGLVPPTPGTLVPPYISSTTPTGLPPTAHHQAFTMPAQNTVHVQQPSTVSVTQSNAYISPPPGGFTQSYQMYAPNGSTIMHNSFPPLIRSCTPSPPQEYTNVPADYIASQMSAQPMVYFDASRPPPTVPHHPPQAVFYTGSGQPQQMHQMQPMMNTYGAAPSTMLYSAQLDQLLTNPKQGQNKKKPKKK